MIRLLPFILIPVLIVSGLGYWRYTATSKNSSSPQATQQDLGLVEVPKTLPDASLEDRIKVLEDTNSKLITEINALKSSSQAPSSSSLDSRLTGVEGATTDLKARVSSLEKSSPSPVVSGSKYPLYIPLGAGGGPWGDVDWNTLTEYQVSINSDNYSGYSSMQLEANFRLLEAVGTGSVRLYNVTDKSSVSSEVSTIGTAFGLQTSNTFKLPSGQKTYTIQVKSTQGKSLFVQSARIKVNF